MSDGYRLGVDIGGTFTDLVMVDLHNGMLFDEKVLTTPDDPSLGVIKGVKKILETNNIPASKLKHIIHGTTLVANAIIQRRGSKVALITSLGFRDIQEIGTESRYDTYDLFMKMPAPLVTRRWRFEVPERIGPDGQVISLLDESKVVDVARAIASSDIDAVAVSLLHSYKNPNHERRIREILQQESPDIIVCISSDVMPEIGEYERTSTTICNAYVLPTFTRYLERLTNRFQEMGVNKDLYLMLSDGGTVHKSTAAIYPIRLVQSGPAGGVQAAAAINKITANEKNQGNILCFDMGGTTAKACLVEDGKPMHANEFEVARIFRGKKGSGIPLKIPVIEMIEIGAGGGSIAHLDNLGLIQVGPESAGADPGPACYSLGGLGATVTDADLILGYLAADNFLGGDIQLDIEASKAVIKNTIADPLSLSVVDAAWAIHETVNESMAQAAAIHALEKAKRITDYTMIPIGGAGPVHACNIALKLNLSQLICPPSAGVASALGFLVSPTSFTTLQGGVVPLSRLNFETVNRQILDMEEQGQKLITKAGEKTSGVNVEILASMRYIGQGYNVEVGISKKVLMSKNIAAIQQLFEAVYLTQFGRIEPHMAIEIVSWRVVTSGPIPEIDLAVARTGAHSDDFSKGRRQIYFGSKNDFISAPVYERSKIKAGHEFEGPAIFEERESTIVVPPGSHSYVDKALNLIINLPVKGGVELS
ncbi:MAG TPA: hydantoinase/oxoprolinase family protein [Gammaproteobacteria bacterium]|jgi:N-methylhydantoinase A|nr:hydantoinase/oxoprolinase family protein [Gammaproteobacteria bacterium]